MRFLAQIGCSAFGAFAAILIAAGSAEAVPIYTYNFEQSGYIAVNDPTGPQGKVTGSFSGSLDQSGYITINTLTEYHFSISGFASDAVPAIAWSNDTRPLIFSYLPGSSSTLTVVEALQIGVNAAITCIGGVAGIVCDSGNALGSQAFSVPGAIIQAALSSTPASVTFVRVVDPDVATTPLPASLLLFGTAISGLGAAASIRRRLRADGVVRGGAA